MLDKGHEFGMIFLLVYEKIHCNIIAFLSFPIDRFVFKEHDQKLDVFPLRAFNCRNDHCSVNNKDALFSDFG